MRKNAESMEMQQRKNAEDRKHFRDNGTVELDNGMEHRIIFVVFCLCVQLWNVEGHRSAFPTEKHKIHRNYQKNTLQILHSLHSAVYLSLLLFHMWKIEHCKFIIRIEKCFRRYSIKPMGGRFAMLAFLSLKSARFHGLRICEKRVNWFRKVKIRETERISSFEVNVLPPFLWTRH